MAATQDIMSAFLWGRGGQPLSYEELQRARAMEAQQAGGIDTSPVGHWTQGAARVAQALAGSVRRGQLDTQIADADSYNSGLLGALFSGGQGGAGAPMAASAPAAAPEGDMSAYQNAIAGIESGGRYDAVGPTHSKLGRALGKYQVMEANVGPWSEAALGRAVTPDEFLANPQIQDQVFNHQFGQYVKQYGPEGAAQAWFAGPGGIGTNRQDALGTSVPEYAQRFTASLGGQPPVRVASADAGDMGPIVSALAQQGNAQPAQPQQAPQQIAQALMQPQQGGMNQDAILNAIRDPRASPAVKQIAAGLLQQMQKQQMEANDPFRRAQLEQLELQNEALRNPQAKPTGDIQEYEFARKQGFPGSFQEYQVMLKEAGRPSTSVNIDQKAQGALEKTLGETVGKTFGTMYEEGAQAGQDLYQIERLRGLLQQSGSGIGPALANAAASFGIKLSDGADAGQAANAIISYLTPRMRVPGTGASSDRDVSLFQKALPSLMNTPQGNALILGTMQGLAEYKRAQGDIAGQVVMGEMDPKEAAKAIRALPDPFAGFKAAQTQQQTAQPTVQDGITATNPQTGEKIIFRNGKWEPIL